MKIVIKFSGKIDSQRKKILIEKALNKTMEIGYFNEDVYEDSIQYDNLMPLIDRLDLTSGVAGTEFETEEIKNADLLIYNGTKALGYPQPENPPEVIRNTYKNACDTCGTHDEQIAPFKIREPKMVKHQIFSLNWIFDEKFVDLDYYKSFFEPLGIGKREVMNYKKNTIVDSVFQLDLPDAPFDLNLNSIPFEICPVCNRTKYSPKIIGFHKAPTERNFSLLKTKEFFGSGYNAHHRVLVTNEIMHQMIKVNLAKIPQFAPMR